MIFSLFKGPFERVGCAFEDGGWVTTDLKRGQRLMWFPTRKQAFRWDVIENRWVPSKESRSEFLSIAREYQTTVRQ